MKTKHRTRRIVLTSVGILLGAIILLLVFISPITKYVVEKYDVKYLGREVKMDWAYVNPFTGYFHFRNFRIYENDKADFGLTADSVFISAADLSVKFSWSALFSKNYEITGLTLDDPEVTLIQNRDKTDFNFKDIIKKFKGDSINPDTTAEPVHFSLLNLRINNGTINYNEKMIPVNYSIKKLDLESSGMRWNVDTVTGKFALVAGVGTGEMKADFMVNKKNLDYRLKTQLHKFDMSLIQQYMRELSNYGTVRAFLDANINAAGNFNNAKIVDAKGKVRLYEFHFGKDPKEDYASFNALHIGIIRMYPARNIQHFDSLLLDKPFFRYEKYDHLDNLQNMFGKKGENIKKVHADDTHFNLIIEIADYVKKLVENFFRSHYKVNRLEINKANFAFADYSINEKFLIAADPLTVEADSVDKHRPRATVTLKSGIAPYGQASVFLSVNPKDSSDFDLNYSIEKIPVPLFNPYLISYTSYPMDRGSVQFKGAWHVRNGNIKSDNRMLVLDPRIAKKVQKKNGKWIPLPLIMAFVRERGNVIDYQIPITGDLKDPKFHISDVLLDLLANIFIKPPTVPYGLKVSETERKIEKTLSFKWEMNQIALRPSQEKFLKKMADFLKENKEARITITPEEYAEKEKEYILLFEARKKYYLDRNKKKDADFSNNDSAATAKISDKDPSFVKYLDKRVGGQSLNTVQEKCMRLVGKEFVLRRYKELVEQRENNFTSFFKENNTRPRVKIEPAKSLVPFNGFSFFKISYEGEIPGELKKAYEEMDELDEIYPRNKYYRERKKIKEFFKLTKKSGNEIYSPGTLGGKP